MSETTHRQNMFSLIDAWAQSNLSKKAFCAGQGISYQRFYYWHKQYRNSSRLPATSSAFIPLALPTDSAPTAELIYPDGKKLLLYHSVDATFLKALLA